MPVAAMRTDRRRSLLRLSMPTLIWGGVSAFEALASAQPMAHKPPPKAPVPPRIVPGGAPTPGRVQPGGSAPERIVPGSNSEPDKARITPPSTAPEKSQVAPAPSAPTTIMPSTTAPAGEARIDPDQLNKSNQPGRFVMALCADKEGCIWIGTEDEGVWRYDEKAPEAKRWKQFTTKDGLGDDNAYAVACDNQGRVWIGHLNHGVSVYNGQTWRNYGVLDGPLGERILDIAVAPNDGSVWIATSAGLTRYSETPLSSAVLYDDNRYFPVSDNTSFTPGGVPERRYALQCRTAPRRRLRRGSPPIRPPNPVPHGSFGSDS